MVRFAAILCVSLLGSLFALAGNTAPANIRLKIPAFASQQIYLGFYYGSYRGLQDSIHLNSAGEGSFQSAEGYRKGIYFIVSEKKEILFEFIMPDQQDFEMHTSSASFPYNLQFINSPENEIFFQYSLQSGYLGQELNRLQQIPNRTAVQTDSMTSLQQQLKILRRAVYQRHPDSFIAHLLQAMEDPEVPPASEHPGGKYDTAYARAYFKENYFGPIDFTDGSYLRTPFFENKVNNYFDYLVVPDVDSIYKEASTMLAYASVDNELYRFLLMLFVSKYMNPQIMGLDEVFVRLFEKEIATGKADFLPKETRDLIFNRAYSIMANLIGKPAAPLELIDIAEKPLSLYQIEAPLTVLCFWDPTCSHCKELMPKLDSIYRREWKAKGIQLIAINVAADLELWHSFVKEHKLEAFVNARVSQTFDEKQMSDGKPGYRQAYDIFQTPLLYLLDADKRIVAKRLDLPQINELIKVKL